MWSGKHVLIGISGGIAAYKVPELIRLFVKAGAEVRVVATKNAMEFVTRLTLETLSMHQVYLDVFETASERHTEHISTAAWADVFIIAPATANVIGKCASGIADDALTTTFLAYTKTVYMAPAMNLHMYENAMVQANRAKLQSAGVVFLEPTAGELACGDVGKGRMQEPSAIFEVVSESYKSQLPWLGKKVLITAGPTYERIDPVRFIGNFSSGKMGFALAEACAQRGATVYLVAGPVALKTTGSRIERFDVVSASDMYEQCVQLFPTVDLGILCAAVADFTPETVAGSKTKRGDEALHLNLKPTADIAATLGARKRVDQLLVGFALETENENQNASDKMKRKNLDFIVLNSLNDPGAGFQHDTNQVTVFGKDGSQVKLELNTKAHIAAAVLDVIDTDTK